MAKTAVQNTHNKCGKSAKRRCFTWAICNEAPDSKRF
jgi:hypothetical protein